MTPEATAIAPSMHTEEQVAAGVTVQASEQRPHAIAEVAERADQRAGRFSMYALKASMRPRLYWHGRLRGRA